MEIAKEGGADGAVVLGQAPIETIDAFIKECKKYNLDSMGDMMNVDCPLEILRKLKNFPKLLFCIEGLMRKLLIRNQKFPT